MTPIFIRWRRLTWFEAIIARSPEFLEQRHELAVGARARRYNADLRARLIRFALAGAEGEELAPAPNERARLVATWLVHAAVDVLIDVVDPQVIGRRRALDGQLSERKRAGLVLGDVRAAPILVGEKGLRARMTTLHQRREEVERECRILAAAITGDQHLRQQELGIAIAEELGGVLDIAQRHRRIGGHVQLRHAAMQILAEEEERLRDVGCARVVVGIDVDVLDDDLAEQAEGLTMIGVRARVVGENRRKQILCKELAVAGSVAQSGNGKLDVTAAIGVDALLERRLR
jgi:hypothetical protein